MVLLVTLSDLDKLNYGEYIKNQLCSSKIDARLHATFQRQNYLKPSQRDTGLSRCSWTPSVTSSRSTVGSEASTSYVHQKLIWHIVDIL